MKCDETRQHWHLFHDSEGDAELHLQINEHLEMCSECSRWFFEQSRLEDGITQRFKTSMTPTAALWAGIENQLAPAERAKTRAWFLFGSAVVAVAACILVVVSFGSWLQQDESEAPDLAQLSVALHDKLATGREGVKFASESPIEVENYLRTQVSFPVRCPPRDDTGFLVRGGGTCKLANDPVAYVVGQVEGQDVSLFILARESLPNFPHEQAKLRERLIHQSRLRGTDVVMKQVDRNLVLVVGRAGAGRMERVLKAYGTYGHDHPVHGDELEQHGKGANQG